MKLKINYSGFKPIKGETTNQLAIWHKKRKGYLYVPRMDFVQENTHPGKC